MTSQEYQFMQHKGQLITGMRSFCIVNLYDARRHPQDQAGLPSTKEFHFTVGQYEIMRQLAMKYSKEKAHELKSQRSFLEKKAKTLELEITADSSEELLEEYHTCKDELESIYNYITEGTILRFKVD